MPEQPARIRSLKPAKFLSWGSARQVACGAKIKRGVPMWKSDRSHPTRCAHKSGRRQGPFDVRYAPNSGAKADIAGLLRWARSDRDGPFRRQDRRCLICINNRTARTAIDHPMGCTEGKRRKSSCLGSSGGLAPVLRWQSSVRRASACALGRREIAAARWIAPVGAERIYQQAIVLEAARVDASTSIGRHRASQAPSSAWLWGFVMSKEETR